MWDELLESEKTDRDGIDLVIPSQPSAGFIAGLPDALGLAPEKVVDVFSLYGDTLTTSPILALHYAREAGLIEAGTRAVFLTVGSGITIGMASYDF